MNPFMKAKLMGLGLLLVVAQASAQTINATNATTTLSDGNPAGLLETINVSGLTGNILNVQVNLNLAGGYNGDLYAYLTGPAGQQAILLNRVGVTSGDAFGFSDAGFSITLDDVNANSGNIHNYGLGSYSTFGNGQVTGTWGSDGRDIDPQSAPGLFDSVATTSNLTQFIGGTADGTWSLFIADLTGGDGAATMNGWGVTFTLESVPEPSPLALGILGSVAGGFLWRRAKSARP